MRAKIPPTVSGVLDVPCAIVILAGTPRQENTSRLSRRLRGRARRAKENWRRESTFSRFAGVGQVGRFALDLPPISCSPPLAPATVRQSTVDTCARSRLPIRISRQRQLTLHGAAEVQASILVEQFLTFLSADKSCSRGTTRPVNQGLSSPELIIQPFSLELIT